MKFYDEKIQNHLLNGGKIKRSSEPFIIFFDSTGNLCYECSNYNISYTINKNDLLADDWEIIEPKYNWNKIIKDKILCVFSSMPDYKDVLISTLTKINDNDHYYTAQGLWYKYCKPFNPKDFNIAENIKEYEE